VDDAHGQPDPRRARTPVRRNLFLDDNVMAQDLRDRRHGSGDADGDAPRVLVIERVDRGIRPTATTSRLAARARAMIAKAGFVGQALASWLRVRLSPRIRWGSSAALASVLIVAVIGTFVALSRVQSDRERARADAAEAARVIGGLRDTNAALAQERDAACRAAVESARALAAARASAERGTGS